MLRRLLVGGTIAGVVAVAGGCGGRSAEGYRGEAEDVCERGTAAIERALASADGDPRQVAERVRAAVNRVAAELGEVEPPDELAREHAELRRVMQEAIEVGEQGRRAGGGDARLRQRYEDLTRRGDELVEELGLDGCQTASG